MIQVEDVPSCYGCSFTKNYGQRVCCTNSKGSEHFEPLPKTSDEESLYSSFLRSVLTATICGCFAK